MSFEHKFYVLNTNRKHRIEDQYEMLTEKFAAAFCENSSKIDQINIGDTVFLYGSQQGIVGYGQASGVILKKDRIKPEDGQLVKDGCHYQKLADFHIMDTPINAQEIKNILERNVSFNQVLFSLHDGQKILDSIKSGI